MRITMRHAGPGDISAIVPMLADDPLGAARESPADLAPYRAAFARIEATPGHLLVVAEAGDEAGGDNGGGRLVGTLQRSIVPGLSRRGACRAVIESVRVHADERGAGLGTRLVRWAIEEARRRGCAVVQLTTDGSRADAHRFYERLGFEPTHVGFKLML